MLPSTLSVERIEAEPERIAGVGRDVDGEKVWILRDGDDFSTYSTCLYPWCPIRNWHAHRLWTNGGVAPDARGCHRGRDGKRRDARTLARGRDHGTAREGGELDAGSTSEELAAVSRAASPRDEQVLGGADHERERQPEPTRPALRESWASESLERP